MNTKAEGKREENFVDIAKAEIVDAEVDACEHESGEEENNFSMTKVDWYTP